MSETSPGKPQDRRGFLRTLAVVAGGAAVAVIAGEVVRSPGPGHRPPRTPAAARPVTAGAGTRRTNVAPSSVPAVRR